MTNDIVERLLAPGHGALADEAAHEITRLRRERDMWRQENLKKQIACEQMGARITELSDARAAARTGWKCPINSTGCTQNCGNYGCGN